MKGSATGWKRATLGDVITLQRGFDLPAQERREGNVPVVSSSGITDHHAEARVKAPGVVTGRYGTIGEVFYVTEDFWPLNTTLWVKDFKGNDPRFVSYLLKTVSFLSHSDKSSVPGVNRNHLHTEPVCLPEDVREQRAIASVLGALDDKIDLNRRMNETLEAMARALFKSWFVDFDPVRAKAGGEQPWGMDAATAALFPEAFEDSELGEIPRGWRVLTVPQAFEVNPQRRLVAGTVGPYLPMSSMPTNSARPQEWEQRVAGSGARFINGDVLVARITPCLENGKTAFVDFLDDATVGWGSTEYIVLRSKPPLPLQFAYLFARTEGFRTFAIGNMTGTSGRQRVPVGCLTSFRLVVPDEHVARAFEHAVAPMFVSMKQRDEESATLAELRDTLLPKLLSGEVRVREAERAVEVAV